MPFAKITPETKGKFQKNNDLDKALAGLEAVCETQKLNADSIALQVFEAKMDLPNTLNAISRITKNFKDSPISYTDETAKKSVDGTIEHFKNPTFGKSRQIIKDSLKEQDKNESSVGMLKQAPKKPSETPWTGRAPVYSVSVSSEYDSRPAAPKDTTYASSEELLKAQPSNAGAPTQSSIPQKQGKVESEYGSLPAASIQKETAKSEYDVVPPDLRGRTSEKSSKKGVYDDPKPLIEAAKAAQKEFRDTTKSQADKSANQTTEKTDVKPPAEGPKHQ